MNIIPKPLSVMKKAGSFKLSNKTDLAINNERIPNFLRDHITAQVEEISGNLLKHLFSTVPDSINPKMQKKTGFDDEGYILLIENDQIIISAEAAQGIFYGIQTLLQLIFQNKNENLQMIELPCCRIEDKPRFSWRGRQLDVSRHFFPVEFIRKYIDLLALHKMNKFHWHLTDDNGWRIEIKKYPLLTETGSWRKNLEHLPWNERENSDEPGNGIYGGFYSQEEIGEVIKYASDRYIEVIPEIEMPGHSSEVFAAYPQYSCLEKTLRVAPGGYWPNRDIFCAGKDETFKFLTDILQEVARIFPSEFIHIGGDEANKTYWKTCVLIVSSVLLMRGLRMNLSCRVISLAGSANSFIRLERK